MALAAEIDVRGAAALRAGAVRPPVAEWLLAMGPVVHGLDYGGRVAVLGCEDAWATALLSAAYPLASLDAVDDDPGAVDVAREVVQRLGAGSRCELEVGRPDALVPGAYDLVCVPRGLSPHPDPVALAALALRAVRDTGAVMVVERTRPDGFDSGAVTAGSWLTTAGAARVRLASATAAGFVLDARAGAWPAAGPAA